MILLVFVQLLIMILIFRRNFTPTPSLAPSIPAWQRSNGNKDGGETVTTGTSAKVTSISSSTATSSSAASLTGTTEKSVVACSNEGTVTSDAWTSAPSGSKDSVFNRGEKVNSNGGRISVNEFTKDSVSSNIQPSFTSCNLLGISYSGKNIQPPHNSTSSLSVTSDVIVSIPDRPDRTSSGDSIVFSDALDGSVVNGVASNEDLTNHR